MEHLRAEKDGETEGDQMKIEEWKIERVIPYASNPRKNDKAVSGVKASIKEFGFQ